MAELHGARGDGPRFFDAVVRLREARLSARALSSGVLAIRYLAAAGLLLLMAPGCGSDGHAREPATGEPSDPAAGGESGDPKEAVTSESSSPPRSEGPVAAGQPGGEAPFDDLISDELAGGAELSPDNSCAASVLQAETIERVVEVPIEEEVVVPTVFYLMLDSSGSMVSDPFTLAGLVEDILDIFGLGQSPPQPTKWDYAVSGLQSFMTDPASAGLELALGYFPDVGACDGSGYDVPAVALGALPDNIAPLDSSLASREPAGGTPLEGALRGATDFCLALNAARPDRSCVAVLITDGAAEECSARGADDLASIAASAAERGVLTYAAGMQGADFAVLDAIGRAGGGDCDPSSPSAACDLTADRDAFVSALDGIRDRTRTRTRIETRIERQVTTLPCEWPIPAAPPGQVFDPTRVNVELTTPGAEPLGIENVAAEADCAGAGGWYYDDAEAPSTIKACAATCEQLGAAPDTRVDLLFGCATNIR
jgi:hypothetical protein